jgi:uncharacterized protein
VIIQDGAHCNGVLHPFLTNLNEKKTIREGQCMLRNLNYLLFSIVIFISTVVAQQNGRINVTGEALITVAPDYIVIRFGIETHDMVLMNARQQYNKIYKNAISAFRILGVREKDIQLDYLRITPEWRKDLNKEVFLGYEIKNSMVVTLTDVSLIEDVVTDGIQAGMNRVDGIDFLCSDIKKYREEARELAIKAAKEKAEKIVALLGQTLGDPTQISFGSSGSPTRYSSLSSMTSNSIQNIEADDNELSETIGLGKISVKANVYITFEFTKQNNQDNK